MYKSGAGSEPGPQSDPESRLITFGPSQDRKERAAVDRDSGQEGATRGSGGVGPGIWASYSGSGCPRFFENPFRTFLRPIQDHFSENLRPINNVPISK